MELYKKKKEPKIKAWSHRNSVNEAVWHVSAAAHERCECDSTKNEEGHTRKPSEYFTSDSSIPKLFLMMRWLLMCRVHAHLEKFSDFLMAWVEKLPEHPSREARPLLPSILASGCEMSPHPSLPSSLSCTTLCRNPSIPFQLAPCGRVGSRCCDCLNQMPHNICAVLCRLFCTLKKRKLYNFT